MSSKTYASLHIGHNNVLFFISNLVHAGFDVVNIYQTATKIRVVNCRAPTFFKVVLVALVSFITIKNDS